MNSVFDFRHQAFEARSVWENGPGVWFALLVIAVLLAVILIHGIETGRWVTKITLYGAIGIVVCSLVLGLIVTRDKEAPMQGGEKQCDGGCWGTKNER